MQDGTAYGAGLPFVRRVELVRINETQVTGSIQDHIHDFQVRVTHADGNVTDIAGSAVRAPWAICAGAARQLADLVGQPIGAQPRVADPSAHCTHLLDVAGHAIRFAGLNLARRSFDITVDGWRTRAISAIANRDDGSSLSWAVEDYRIVSPKPFAGRDVIGPGFTAWAAATVDPDIFELAVLLRRATAMSSSRGIDLDLSERLSDTDLPAGTCFASQPHRIDAAVRNRGTSASGIPRWRSLTVS